MARTIGILAVVLVMASPSLGTELFGGRTALFYSAEGGTSVIFFTKRGSDAYLWYPGSGIGR